MDKLNELYAKRKVFEDYGAPIPTELAEEIEQEQRRILLNAPYWFMEHVPQDACLEIHGNFTVHIEYNDDKLVGVGASYNFSAKENSDVYLDNVGRDSGDDSGEDEPGEDEPGIRSPRSKSIKFSVTFPDGKVFNYNKAQWTLIDSLKHMGLERVSRYTAEKFKGFPLVGRRQRVTPDGQKWQKLVDGWWIYINMSNERKVRCLQGVAAMLNIPIVIKWEEAASDDPDYVAEPLAVAPKPKGKNARFSLNGSEPMAKNRSVFESVRRFISQFPDATFEDVAEMFPKHLQGSYGVVRTIDDITVRSTTHRTENDRWFLDPSDILTSADGKRFAVSTQWGDNFADFRNHIAKELGWTIKEV